MVSQMLVNEEDAVPGAAIAIQTFGDFLGFNPHTHILISDGCFHGEGKFKLAPEFYLKDLEALCQPKVLKGSLEKAILNERLHVAPLI